MTRRRVKRVKIAINSKRNTVLRNRTTGLLKKAEELCVLCDSNIGIVIHKREQNNATLWPSADEFRSHILKFLEIPEIEREKKMIVHEKHLQKKIEEDAEKLKNIKKRNDMKEYQNLLNEFIEGKNIDQLDLDQMNAMSSIAAEKVKELSMREEQLNAEDAPTVENLMSDSWFMSMMFDS